MNRVLTTTLVTLTAAALIVPMAHAQSDAERRDRVVISYLLAFGRIPASAELSHWAGRREKDWTVAALVESHRAFLQSNTTERTAVVVRSYQMAMGRNPEQREVNDHLGRNRTYAELMTDHVEWMKSGKPWLQLQGDALKAMVDRSYKAAGFTWYATPLGQFRKSEKEKQAGVLYDDGDIDYWKNEVKSKNFTYGQLVVKHLSYKSNYCRKPIPTPSIKIGTTVRNQAASVPGASDLFSRSSHVIANGGMNVIAVGGMNIIANGGMNIIANGGMNIVVLDGKPYGS